MLHVYIAADQRGRHKIGVTNNPLSRCRQLSRDLGGERVEMVHIEAHSRLSRELERLAHEALASHHDGGEWFVVERSAALAALELARLQAGAPPRSPGLPAAQTVRPAPSSRGGRKKEFEERITLPLAKGKPQEIDSALKAGEARVEFIRDAIDAELARRKALGEGKA